MMHPTTIRGFAAGAGVALFAVAAVGFAVKDSTMSTRTPTELVATYESLADVILGAKKSESNLVLSILATVHGHAEGLAAQVHAALKSGDKPAVTKGLEDLADLVSQLGTEGDNSVGRVRKRLLEGGHHHNAQGEAQGIFEEGYVIVTRAAKKVLVDASRAIAQLSRDPTAAGLDAEWRKVETAYAELVKAKK